MCPDEEGTETGGSIGDRELSVSVEACAPMKRGLKPLTLCKSATSSRVEACAPMKRGLKHCYKLPMGQDQQVEACAPMKRGLKPNFPNCTLSKVKLKHVPR